MKSKKKILISVISLCFVLAIGLGIAGYNYSQKYNTETMLANIETLTEDQMMKLTERTLLVCSNVEPADTGAISIQQNGNVYTLTYDNDDLAEDAYETYSSDSNTIYCEYDAVMKVQTQESETPELYDSLADAIISQEVADSNEDVYNNVLTEYNDKEYIKADKAVIAVIDSGANGSWSNAYNVLDGSSDVTDTSGHGTQMVDIIKDGLVGYEDTYEIVPIKIANDNGVGSVSTLISALEYVSTLDDVAVVNLSLTSNDLSKADILETYIKKLGHNGVAVVTSAGNFGDDTSYYIPAKFEDAIVVGSCDKVGVIKDFSNYGESIDYLVTSDSTSEAAAITSALYTKAYLENVLIRNVLSESDIIFDYNYENNASVMVENDNNVSNMLDDELWWCAHYMIGSSSSDGYSTLSSNGWFFGWANTPLSFIPNGTFTVYYEVWGATATGGVSGKVKNPTIKNNSSTNNSPYYMYKNSSGRYYAYVHADIGDGLGWFYCGDVKKAKEDAAHTHSYTINSGVQYKAATCTSPRYNYLKCACGHNPKSASYITAVGSALGHNYTIDSGEQYKAATCTSPRYNYKKCSRCGYNPKSASYIVQYGSALGHTETGSWWEYADNNSWGRDTHRYKKCGRKCGHTLTTQYAVYASDSTTATATLKRSNGTTFTYGDWFDYGASVTITGTPKTGYLWHKWTGTVAGPANPYTFTVTGPFWDTANGTPKVTTVTFHKNDGSTTTAPQSFTYAATGTKKFGYKADGTVLWNQTGQFGEWDRTGYELQGWSHDSDAAPDTDGLYGIYSSVADWWINKYYSTTDLYAVWKPNTYKAVFDKQKGTGGTDSVDSVYDSSTRDDVTIPTRTGYNFGGYYTQKAGKGTQWWDADGKSIANTWKAASDFTFYAYWIPVTAEVTFYRNLDSSDTVTNTHIFTYDVANQKFASTGWTKTGYKFNGYSTDRNATSGPYSLNNSVSNDWILAHVNGISLYATWKPLEYKVVYNANGGTGSLTETWTYDTAHETYNNAIGKKFQKTGYYIDYWYTTSDSCNYGSDAKFKAGGGYSGSKAISTNTAEYTNLITPDKDGDTITLYAHWAPIRYKITFGNDTTNTGHGEVYTTSTFLGMYSYGNTYNVPTTVFERSNKFGESEFLGFSLKNGDTSLKPLLCNVDSPDDIRTTSNVNFTQSIFSSSKTTKGTTYANYFKYLPIGDVQSFALYAVYNDCPGISPVDAYYNMDTVKGAAVLGTNPATASTTELESKLLSINAKTIYDRESGTTAVPTDSSHYYCEVLQLSTMQNQNVVTSYEIKYTITDKRGLKYTQSAMLYSGHTVDIKVN